MAEGDGMSAYVLRYVAESKGSGAAILGLRPGGPAREEESR